MNEQVTVAFSSNTVSSNLYNKNNTNTTKVQKLFTIVVLYTFLLLQIFAFCKFHGKIIEQNSELGLILQHFY